MEGVPDLPVAPQDEAGLTTTFQTEAFLYLFVPFGQGFMGVQHFKRNE